MKRENVIVWQIILLIFYFLIQLIAFLKFNEIIFVLVVLGTIVLLAYMLKKLINRKL